MISLRLGWKFSARKRGMYRRRPRRRLGKRAEPAPAPRQRRDRIPPSEARRQEEFFEPFVYFVDRLNRIPPSEARLQKPPTTEPEVLRAEAWELLSLLQTHSWGK